MNDNFEIKRRILDKIKQYDRIIVTRHFRPDGDAIGSSKGLARMLKLSFPQKEVYVINEDSSEYLAFLGGEDAPIADEKYSDALVIVCDTATTDRISNKKFSLAKEIVKIDHHIDVKPYGDLSWVEEERSSLCEMIADFWLTFKNELTLDKEGATYIFTGMVTDSGRFRFSSVDGETMRRAGALWARMMCRAGAPWARRLRRAGAPWARRMRRALRRRKRARCCGRAV